MSQNMVEVRVRSTPAETDGCVALVTAILVINARAVPVISADIFVGREPTVRCEMPPTIPFSDIPELTRILKEFEARVREIHEMENT